MSNLLERIKKELNFTNYETNQLSAFDEEVLKEGWDILKKGVGITNPYRYLLKCCEKRQSARGNEQQLKKQTTTAKQITPYKPKRITDWDKFKTVVAVANEIAKIKALNSSLFIGGEGFKQRMLTNWAHKDYELTDEIGEAEAIMYIEAARKQYSFIKPAEIKPQSNTIKDNSLAKYIAQTFKKDSTNSNVVQVANIENSELDYNQFEEDFSNFSPLGF